ncbi:AraC family transcriptional regulator [Konateibacter massiliensis]|uniref:AraC family transcriptional regulator n=1 Tax=Konateibacter massiliensis TaxID=2002841 RepID=UPI000C161C64|nr:effector binding domain-containing protein [Konateibacter massiliensis]
MEWNEKLQRIIDYVENHLQRKEEPINPKEISQIAGCSFDFFQKVFSYMNNISFAEYVRLRKLTLAGYDLKSTNNKVVDISYKYGYDSPTSFTKAFQQFHGVSPKEARNSNIELKVYPKMQFFSTQKYSWKLEQKSSFRLIGKRINVSCNDNAHYTKIPEFWSECQRNGVFSKLISMDYGNPKGLFGLFGTYDEQRNEIEYSIMVLSNQELPQEFIEIIIPDVTWAIFDCKGAVPQAIQNGWNYLNEEWLIKYPFQHAQCPELEWYSDGNSYDENYVSQIWIPIIEEE